jgi:hypothetical protein
VVSSPPKEELKAFGGTKDISEFRRGFLTIESYEWVQLFYSPRELVREDERIPRQYLYTLAPLRRTKLLEQEDEDDPVIYIKRRVY